MDGLHGLGLVPNPDSYPDRYVEEDTTVEAGPSASTSTPTDIEVPVSEPEPVSIASTSSSSTSNALADSSATRYPREDKVEVELSSSWNEVRND